MRIIVVFLIWTNLFSQDVFVAKTNISFKQTVTKNDFNIISVDPKEIPRTCEVFPISQIDLQRYVTTKYIRQGSVICSKDLALFDSKEVVFDFGSLEIKTDGEIINETNESITIKKYDGSVVKIFKDGRER